jgi:hypothetical protein
LKDGIVILKESRMIPKSGRLKHAVSEVYRELIERSNWICETSRVREDRQLAIDNRQSGIGPVPDHSILSLPGDPMALTMQLDILTRTRKA